jgi:branched-chain amino acid transport system permease protein
MGTLPGTVWLDVTLAGLAFRLEFAVLFRRNRLRETATVFGRYVILPLLPAAVALLLRDKLLPVWGQILLTTALVLPIGPLLYRIVFQPIATASILGFLMVSVALHFVLSGMVLIYFGPEAFRVTPYVPGDVTVAAVTVSAQTILIIAAALILSLGLFAYFSQTTLGMALRACAMNRTGARIVGIRPATAGVIAFLLAGFIACCSGILIAPTMPLYYDSGFLIGLKGFVGSTLGGFLSYPLSALGAVSIGVLESYVAFEWSALKEVIVFFAILPVIIWRYHAFSREADQLEEPSH